MMRASTPLFRCYPVPDKEPDKGDAWRLADFEASSPGSRVSSSCAGVAPEPLEMPGFVADSDIATEIRRVGHPWAGPMLIFDCETLTGAKDGQGLRFGCFQERGRRYDRRVADAAMGRLTREKLDTCWHGGIFYEPKHCTKTEVEVLVEFATKYELDLYTRDEFVRKILHRNHYVKYAANWQDRLREPCYVIGHNLPFDLGALSIDAV